ncbi:MAG: TetR/AcrR family transcriptional regulator [Lachnospiraceae bacterium]|nr:TetR/AcrR family transcriptional regulator [Lachnospiraceae bacterium]
MAFSKGKRIEDETSRRIIDLAVGIGCREGEGALTVTRLCRELSCDRRVIYNRFRDIDEINMLVARRCNEELIKKAAAAVKEDASYCDNLLARIITAFTCVYERNSYFQYYTACYEVSEDGVQNGFLQDLECVIEEGKVLGEVNAAADSRRAAESLWLIMTSAGKMLALNSSLKYQDALDTVKFGVLAVLEYIKA